MNQLTTKLCAGAHRFTHFGPSDFLLQRGKCHRLPIGGELADVRRELRQRCPQRPGVYGFIDRSGRLIYVGMSAHLQSRLLTYLQRGESNRKETRVALHAGLLVWEVVGHQFAAQLRELELIRRYQPRFNVKGREPDRPRVHIYLTTEDAPRFRVAAQVPVGVRHAWGPLPHNSRLREAVDILNVQFRLRDCPSRIGMQFADQGQLFSLDLRVECLRGETGSCLGPCAGRCTRSDYMAQLVAARAFLDRRDDTLIIGLAARLRQVVEQQQYERAARLRDTLTALEGLIKGLHALRPCLHECFVYPVRVRRASVWYLIAKGCVKSMASAPANRNQAESWLKIVRSASDTSDWESDNRDWRAAKIVAAWFKARPAELQAVLSPEEVERRCEQLLHL
jgi:excinuclease ABC subunit C